MFKIGKKVKFRNPANTNLSDKKGTIISEGNGFFTIKMDDEEGSIVYLATETDLMATRGRPRKI